MSLEAKLKHLEFIQNVITRMNANSFLLKGWCVTLVAALFALASRDSNSVYLVIAFIPLPAFWLLDAFYLSRERQYRKLYEKVSKVEPSEVDFSMNIKSFTSGCNSWPACILSKTLWPFYGVILIALTLVLRSIR